jgi:hypothetical protein
VRRAAACAAALLAAGCLGRASDRDRPVDERLLAALEEARAWQHRADVHLADGAAAEAQRDVEQVLQIHFPVGAPEGEEARLDAFARLGKLSLDGSEAGEERALAQVERGRREATRDSFYRAHLETVAGEAYEARGKRIATAGDEAAAKAARRQALAAYQRSIEINQRVQQALLKEAP